MTFIHINDCPPLRIMNSDNPSWKHLQVPLLTPSVRIAGGVEGLNPPTSPCRPPTSGQNSTPGGRVSTPHLSFAEVGMLLDSHFLLMQFLKYLQHDDLNVTLILIHIED